MIAVHARSIVFAAPKAEKRRAARAAIPGLALAFELWKWWRWPRIRERGEYGNRAGKELHRGGRRLARKEIRSERLRDSEQTGSQESGPSEAVLGKRSNGHAKSKEDPDKS
ncbi:MAG: hypothetical protein R2835_03100 [Thermomicrobiales bacterium]